MTNATKNHRCGRCRRDFARLEHLQRHERSHTKEKPFKCKLATNPWAKQSLLAGWDGLADKTSRDLLRRHDRLTHDMNSEAGDDAARFESGQASPQAQTQQLPPEMLLEESMSDMPMMSIPNHDAASSCAPIPMVDFDMNESNMVMGNYFDDFASFMDNVPIPNSVFSPSYQPMFAFLPGSADPVSFHGHAETLREAEQPFPLGAQQQNHSSAGDSALSAYGSRLPSLQPEDRPDSPFAHRNNERHQQQSRNSQKSHRNRNGYPEVSTQDRDKAMQELAGFSSCLPANLVLPTKHALSRFVSGYLSVFNDHYPFLHTHTLRLGAVRVELFLAIAAVGARYSREPEASNELFHLAKAVAQERLRRTRESGTARGSGPGLARKGDAGDTSDDARSGQIETMQALVLLIAIATWFKRRPDMYEALSIRSILDSLVREDNLQHERVIRPSGWMEWVRYESLKRTKLVIFCFFNIHSIVFDMPPMMLSDQLRQDLPCAENEWKAGSEQEWLACHDGQIMQEDSKTALERLFEPPEADRALVSLFPPNGGSPSSGFSPLGGCVLIHAIIQRIWLVRNSGFYSGHASQQLSPDIMSTFERALKSWSSCWESGLESSMDPLSPHGPLSFTSTALLRLAYIRINMDLGPIRSLDSWDPSIIARSLDSSPPAQRSHRLTRAALHCAHALSIPVKLGINYVAQTQVVYWSNQHALCSLECAVLLAKWLEAVTVPEPDPPLNPAERRMLDFVVQLVAETHYKGQADRALQDKCSLSSTVVRLWASLYKAESVWEMVDLIARSLNAFADLLETRSRASEAPA
ncbi:unnamed protein product [Clonostachys rhizophaga]|uniref:C2H2-type domain-containing protein n=1 Tax=Clonostachys rhizophaga TaxID=160324 RepID=A0A9N9YKA4_9HYPO|nr:unnamed protein product [Clonostachys rhizophaga]